MRVSLLFFGKTRPVSLLGTPFHSSSSVEKRTTETFVDSVVVGGERQRVEFQREIVWLRVSESRLVYRHGGVDLKAESVRTDFDGPFTSIEPEHHDVERLLHLYQIDRASTLELVIVARVLLRPCVETPECARYNAQHAGQRKSQWVTPPANWSYEKFDEHGVRLYPRLADVELCDEVVWSSQASPDLNAQMQQYFRARFMEMKLIEV